VGARASAEEGGVPGEKRRFAYQEREGDAPTTWLSDVLTLHGAGTSDVPGVINEGYERKKKKGED